MDPLSQGTVGAAAAQSTTSSNKKLGLICLLGFLSGMAPDLDILIRSDTDPLLFLEYHRQFTHSLLFIPIGSLICTALFHPLFCRDRLTFWQTYRYCLAGYATHGLLDACTTYGTQLFWPFSTIRIAWNNISIIDPLFTIPPLLLIIIAVVRKKALWGKMAFGYMLLYLIAGYIQHERVEYNAYWLAHSRNHIPIRLEAKPSFANLILWRVVYETETDFYVDAIRATTEVKLYPGTSAKRIHIEKDYPELDRSSQQYQDLVRFHWFSNGYIARDPDDHYFIGDIRFARLPNSLKPIWGILLDPETPEKHIHYEMRSKISREGWEPFWKMLQGHSLEKKQ